MSPPPRKPTARAHKAADNQQHSKPAASKSKFPRRTGNYTFSDTTQVSFSDDGHIITFKVCISGIPRPLYRACSSGKGKKPHFYNPVPADKETLVKSFNDAITHWNSLHPTQPVRTLNHKDHPVSLTCKFFFPRPKHHYFDCNGYGKLRIRSNPPAPILVTKTPDTDNCLKLVMDSLTSILYGDDCSVAHIQATKLWWAPNKSFYTPGQDTQGHTLVSLRQYRSGTAKPNCACFLCLPTK